jgi:hypothetical protein
VSAPPGDSAAHGPAREIAFEVYGRPYAFVMPRPGNPSVASVFLVGLPKAGSTLLNQMMRPITAAAGLSFVALQETMYGMGVAPRDIPAAVNDAFEPAGYAYGGFRSLPREFSIPPFAADRTVLLVRDPRDMLTSLYFSLARSHRPPGTAVGETLAAAFNAQRDEANRTSIDDFALEKAEIVINQFRIVRTKLSSIPHRLYRYEDVVYDKLVWARDMVDYLGLKVPASVIEEAVAANDTRPDLEDPTRHVRRVSPGDHREKLREETIVALNARLKPILRRYQYL